MWFGLENRLVSYADDATLNAPILSPGVRELDAETLSRNLAARINPWRKSWSMTLNPILDSW